MGQHVDYKDWGVQKPNDYESMLAKATTLVRHPLAINWLDKAASRECGGKVQTPEDVVGEQFAMGAAVLLHDIACPVPMPDAVRLSLSQSIVTSTPYLWVDGTASAVWCTDPPPKHIVSDELLPFPLTWFTFESGMGVVHAPSHTLDGILLAALPRMQIAGFSISGPAKSGSDLPLLLVPIRITPGSEYDGVDIGIGQILGAIGFINSPHITVDKARCSRPWRKRVKHANRPPAPSVRFIDLRRAKGTNSHEATERNAEWKHRWIVSGHFRAQWYASKKAHKIIWIAPHMKGPDDAPLLKHAYRVVR